MEHLWNFLFENSFYKENNYAWEGESEHCGKPLEKVEVIYAVYHIKVEQQKTELCPNSLDRKPYCKYNCVSLLYDSDIPAICLNYTQNSKYGMSEQI